MKIKKITINVSIFITTGYIDISLRLKRIDQPKLNRYLDIIENYN